MNYSQRIQSLSASITLSISAKAKSMKASGIDVVGFGAGEPDFDTPFHIKEAAKKAIDEGFTKYTPASGIHELKKAVCETFKHDLGLAYEPREVLISCGAKHSLFNTILALCNEKDEVILPTPYWVSYPEMIKAAGAKAVMLEALEKNEFKITPHTLEKALTPRTKLLILNSPSNPTGLVYTKKELEAIAALLIKHKIWCISDEIYAKILYDGACHVSIASLNSKMKDLTVVINGVSKAYSMTGWRIGYAAGPCELIEVMSNLQSHSTSNPCSLSQRAAIAALQGDQGVINTMNKAFDERRRYIVKRLNTIKGITCLMPKGAFYVFPSIQGLLSKKCDGKSVSTSLEFCTELLEKALVAAVPGIGFGSEGFMRLSYATSMQQIKKGMDRLEEFAKSLT